MRIVVFSFRVEAWYQLDGWNDTPRRTWIPEVEWHWYRTRFWASGKRLDTPGSVAIEGQQTVALHRSGRAPHVVEIVVCRVSHCDFREPIQAASTTPSLSARSRVVVPPPGSASRFGKTTKSRSRISE